MIYALDTNIISYILRGDCELKQRWKHEETQGNKLVIPLIAYYEVKRGLIAVNSTNKLKAFEHICKRLKVIELTVKEAQTASYIYSKCKNNGRPIEDADLFIAAQCISNGYTLVTNNIKHFDYIDDLSIINWVKETNLS